MIVTKSGLMIDNPKNLQPADVRIEDVLWSLSHMTRPRFSGHTVHIWTEGLHSLHVAEIAEGQGMKAKQLASVMLYNAALAYGIDPWDATNKVADVLAETLGLDIIDILTPEDKVVCLANEREAHQLVICDDVCMLAELHPRVVFQRLSKMYHELLGIDKPA